MPYRSMVQPVRCERVREQRTMHHRALWGQQSRSGAWGLRWSLARGQVYVCWLGGAQEHGFLARSAYGRPLALTRLPRTDGEAHVPILLLTVPAPRLPSGANGGRSGKARQGL